MNEIAETRPDFFEGQYLGADDLDTLVTYLRNHLARHALGAHTWGIVSGLELVEVPAASGGLDVYLLPGYAVDGYGRAIIVLNPCRLTTDLFAQERTGAVPLWLRFDEGPMQGVRRGFAVCDSSDNYARVAESFTLEAGIRGAISDRQAGVTVAGEAFEDARQVGQLFDPAAPLVCDASVAYQELPRPEDADRWLIPLGRVGWDAAKAIFTALGDEQRLISRQERRYLGVVAEQIFAPDGVIRLRDRKTSFSEGNSIDDQCKVDAIQLSDIRMCNGKPEFNELIWLEGRVRVTGDTRMFGTRLEFRDSKGSDYTNSTPLIIQRNEINELKGQDLELLIGQSKNGSNRLVVGQLEAKEDQDKCTTTYTLVNTNRAPVANLPPRLLVIQDDGKVGVGTNAPDRLVTVEGADSAYLNVRTEVSPKHEILIGADSNGAIVSAMTNDDLLLRAGGNSTKVTIKASGDVGIGTGNPQAKLDVAAVKASSGGSPLGQDKWLQVGNGGDFGRFWVEYGDQAAPLLVLSDQAFPPRIQFQQTGTGQENNPQFISWIGQSAGLSTDITITAAHVGIGTMTPQARLDITQVSESVRSKWLQVGNGGDGGRFWVEYGTALAPLLVLSDLNDPPRIQFQQTATGSEDNPQYASWIGHSRGNANYLTLMADRVGIGTELPTEKLYVNGNATVNGDVTATGDVKVDTFLFAPGSTDNLRIIAGAVFSGGATNSGTGFSSSRTGLGRYRINFNTSFTAPPVVLVTTINPPGGDAEVDTLTMVRNVSSSGFDVVSKDTTPAGTGEGSLEDTEFSFVAFGLR